MALVMHALRPGDLFVDVGANIGSYSILAAGVCGSHVIAVEPVPQTFRNLQDNVRLNDLQDFIATKNVALGASAGTVRFSSDRDTANHAIADGSDDDNSILVPQEELDSLLKGM